MRIFSLEPEARISMKLSWYEVSKNQSNFTTGDENFTHLQIYVDSVRHLSLKYRPYVEVSINNQPQQTSPSLLKNEVAKYQKHFNFMIKNPKNDILEVRVIDQLSTITLGEYNYQISELLLRKNFEHELQAFPLNSSHDFELIFALKLNPLKIHQES